MKICSLFFFAPLITNQGLTPFTTASTLNSLAANIYYESIEFTKKVVKVSTSKNGTALAVKWNDLFAAIRQFRVGGVYLPLQHNLPT